MCGRRIMLYARRHGPGNRRQTRKGAPMARWRPGLRPEPRQPLLDVPLGLAVGLLTWWSVFIGHWVREPGGPPWMRGDESPYGPPAPADPSGPGGDLARTEVTWLLVVGILMLALGLALRRFQIGRASGRERVEISVVA